MKVAIFVAVIAFAQCFGFELPMKHIDTRGIELPERFDAREQWPNCESIKEITDESASAGDWAMAAVEAMSDRICIASGGTVQPRLSVEDVLSCCNECGDDAWLFDSDMRTWDRWQVSGITTGGAFNTTTGCKAFSFPPCDHYESSPAKIACGNLPPHSYTHCYLACDKGSNLSYDDELFYASEVYTIAKDEQQIMAEIYQHGPVEASFLVFEDFFYYRSGVYIPGKGQSFNVGTHYIKILGWGVEKGTKYWLVANSWNEDWGDKGFFKLPRGDNYLGIENRVIAGLPKLDLE